MRYNVECTLKVQYSTLLELIKADMTSLTPSGLFPIELYGDLLDPAFTFSELPGIEEKFIKGGGFNDFKHFERVDEVIRSTIGSPAWLAVKTGAITFLLEFENGDYYYRTFSVIHNRKQIAELFNDHKLISIHSIVFMSWPSTNAFKP